MAVAPLAVGYAVDVEAVGCDRGSYEYEDEGLLDRAVGIYEATEREGRAVARRVIIGRPAVGADAPDEALARLKAGLATRPPPGEDGGDWRQYGKARLVTSPGVCGGRGSIVVCQPGGASKAPTGRG
jgi:hypothetical protein